MSLWDNICQLMGCVIMDKLPALEMLTALDARYFLFGYHSQCSMNGNSLSNISSIHIWAPALQEVGYLNLTGVLLSTLKSLSYIQRPQLSFIVY